MDFIKNFSKVSVLVVGDVMLDRYWWGSVNRISPEAPVPIVNLEKLSLAAGGAANVAANVAGLGAEALLVGVIGIDEEAGLLKNLLNEKKVSTEFLIKLPNRQTTVKTRVIAHNQQVVRVDQETKTDLTDTEADKIWQTISHNDLLDSVKIVIVSDYGKGIITEKFLSRLITTAKKMGKLVLVDPKGRNYSKYKGVTLMTPNRFEIGEACNLDNLNQETIEAAGDTLLSELDLEGLLITQGEAGMTLFEKNKKTTHLGVSAKSVYDVTGAGDTVIASLAAALGGGANFLEAAKFANQAAGLVVEQMGTTAVSLEMIRDLEKSRQ